MKRKQYSEEKIFSILKEHEAGASAKELSRPHGVAENTVYRWKAKFGGMEVSEARRPRDSWAICAEQRVKFFQRKPRRFAGLSKSHL